MKRTMMILLAVSIAVLAVGCGRNKLPDDLPKLFPCKITIVDKGGKPIGDATVGVSRSDSKWAGIGRTGADGSLSVQTHAMYAGLPPGSYKVTVKKYETVPGTSDEEKMIFAPEFGTEETTPLQCEIEEKPNEFKFEVW